ncbi:hypothetical protein MTR67_024100 [Solanum verrucosum]|uniref:Tf2-1-like SH3-like domain-containing protein n=1 Tax=Solanum verrucosum TaxID=315347 RepID=A0AAF0TY90_SOLVR|nr:hypothetical protein MTR67_024100 [Solanum verrucosum]
MGRDTNVMADALSQKTVGMGSLACVNVSKRPLAKEIQTLESKFMQLGISERGGALASIEVRATFIDEIKANRLRMRIWRSLERRAGDVKPLGVDLVKDAQDKVRSIQAKLLASQSRQKKYADHKVRDMTFQTGENVLLKVSPMEGVMIFGKKGKLSPRYIGPFEILECVGPVAYRLALPPNLLGVHPVFHVSMLKRYHGDGDYIIK